MKQSGYPPNYTEKFGFVACFAVNPRSALPNGKPENRCWSLCSFGLNYAAGGGEMRRRMFDGFPKSKFNIVTSEGVLRGTTEAIATGKEIIVPDQNVIIQPGDEMRRTLPNGTDETFDVIDPVFMQETFGIPGHFQVKVRKKGMFPHGTGGNYTISVTGPNSRVNIGSTDQSTNINIDQSVISKVRQAITAQVEDNAERAALLSALADMESAGDKSALSAAYQRFISSAANHMSVIAPFLPALGQMFGG